MIISLLGCWMNEEGKKEEENTYFGVRVHSHFMLKYIYL